jgi:hypothetical protein
MQKMQRARLPTGREPGPDDNSTGEGNGVVFTIAAARRRRAAERRLRPQRRDVVRLDDLKQLRAWASACHHLRSQGLEPIPPDYVRRSLIRRGWW